MIDFPTVFFWYAKSHIGLPYITFLADTTRKTYLSTSSMTPSSFKSSITMRLFFATISCTMGIELIFWASWFNLNIPKKYMCMFNPSITDFFPEILTSCPRTSLMEKIRKIITNKNRIFLYSVFWKIQILHSIITVVKNKLNSKSNFILISSVDSLYSECLIYGQSLLYFQFHNFAI
jgi:hypothetical protein